MTIGSGAKDGIKLESLSKSYGSVRAVRSIDVEITSGETVAILGPNGAGKTTTIDMMLGLTRPDSGKISVFGMEPGEAVRAGVVGGMLQTGTPIPYLSTRELITMVASLYPNPISVDEALRLSGTGDIADRQTTKLSGGQTQRVRFAIALVANAELLVLDEPTAAIDVEGRRDFWGVMREIAVTGKTVIFATHYLEEADAYADRIIVMARGRIVADGSATEIKAIVSNRTIRATLADVEIKELKSLPGVVNAERHGDAVLLSCNDSDAALRELLARNPGAHDIEVHGAGIEEAFLELTTEDEDDEESR
jgi:ABC-2 type transport system ATP-binding protein